MLQFHKQIIPESGGNASPKTDNRLTPPASRAALIRIVYQWRAAPAWVNPYHWQQERAQMPLGRIV
jgi:hypothetical protein